MRAKVKECELTKPFPDVPGTPWMSVVGMEADRTTSCRHHEKLDPFGLVCLGITHMHGVSRQQQELTSGIK